MGTHKYNYTEAATGTVKRLVAEIQARGANVGNLLTDGYSDKRHDDITHDLVNYIIDNNHDGDIESTTLMESLTLCLDMADWFGICMALKIPVTHS